MTVDCSDTGARSPCTCSSRGYARTSCPPSAARLNTPGCHYHWFGCFIKLPPSWCPGPPSILPFSLSRSSSAHAPRAPCVSLFYVIRVDTGSTWPRARPGGRTGGYLSTLRRWLCHLPLTLLGPSRHWGSVGNPGHGLLARPRPHVPFRYNWGRATIHPSRSRG